MSYQSQKFEEHAQQVLKMIKGMKKDSERFGENISVLAKHLNNAQSKMEDVRGDYVKLDAKIGVMEGEGVDELNG